MPVACVHYVVLKACEVNFGTEVEHEVITERFRLVDEVACQTTVRLHRKAKAPFVRNHLTIVAPTQEEGRVFGTSYRTAKVPKGLQLLLAQTDSRPSRKRSRIVSKF